MKSPIRKIYPTLLAAILFLGSGCGGGSSDWREFPYDVPSGKSLNAVALDISTLSGISFSIAPELQAKLDAEPPQLPVLLGLNAGQVLTLLQDSMPQESAFLYEELGPQSILLRPRFQQSANLAAAAPITIVDFDQFARLGFRALISDPSFEEEVCGGPDDGTLSDLGSGGIFEIVTEVSSDPGGHAPFIGEFPPLVELSIEGNLLTVSGADPWVTVSGEIQNDGSFACGGSGTVAGFPDVSVEFSGQAEPGLLSGTLTVGANGELPGGDAAIYNVHP